MENNNSPIPLSQAVEAIKTAILQGQYEALKDSIVCNLSCILPLGNTFQKTPEKVFGELVISIDKFGGRNRRIKIVRCD